MQSVQSKDKATIASRWWMYAVLFLTIPIVLFALIFPFIPESFFARVMSSWGSFLSQGGIENLKDVLLNAKKTIRLMALISVLFIAISVFLLLIRSRIPRTYIPPERTTESKLLVLERRDLWLIPLILLFGFLCFPALNQGLWWDEAWTMRFVNGSWLGILAPDRGNNHLLSTVLIKIAVSLFGDREWAIRFPSFLCGILSVAGSFYLGKCFSFRMAIFSAFLTAVSYATVFNGVNARGYSILTACGLWIPVILFRTDAILTKSQLTFYGIISMIAITTVPTGAILSFSVLIAFAIKAFLSDNVPLKIDTLRLFRAFLLSGIIALLVYSWSLPLRLSFIAQRDVELHNFFEFLFSEVFSYYGGIAKDPWTGVIVFLFPAIGLYNVFKRNQLMALYIILAIGASLFSHYKSGFGSFWYSAMGMCLVPFLVAAALFGAEKSYLGYKKVLPFIPYAIFVLFSLFSVRSIWTPRTLIKEIATDLKKHQSSSSEPLAVVEAIPPITYYFQKFNIAYDSFRDGESLVKSPERTKYKIILAHRDEEMIKRDFNEFQFKHLPGWIDSFYVFWDKQTIWGYSDEVNRQDAKEN